MIDAVSVEGAAERIGDVLLPDDFGERCRTIGAIQSHASRLPAITDSAAPSPTAVHSDLSRQVRLPGWPWCSQPRTGRAART
ncbi:Uncharacterised protein [Mycobacteroides abscessus subsp. abscessus]|nr:Uncharacterised protein [Mycobacteroides abscessus subsp. abscessus]